MVCAFRIFPGFNQDTATVWMFYGMGEKNTPTVSELVFRKQINWNKKPSEVQYIVFDFHFLFKSRSRSSDVILK